MKINAVITAKKNGTQNIAGMSDLIISFLSSLLGIIIGATLSVIYSDFFKENLKVLFVNYTSCSDKAFIEIFAGIFTENLLYIITVVILGTSIIGYIPIIAVTFFKMLGIGTITGFIFSQYALRGLEFYLLTQLAGKIFLIFAIVFITKNCLSSSKSLGGKILKNTGNEYKKQIFIKQIILSVITVFISSLTDALLLKGFSSLFVFT